MLGISQRVIFKQGAAMENRLDDVPNLDLRKVRNRVSALLACRGTDLLHAHEAHAAQVAYAVGSKRRRYLITRRHYNPIGRSRYTRAVYNHAEVVVAISSAVDTSVQQQFPDVRIVRIPDCWMPGAPDPQMMQSLRHRYEGKFLIGYVAAMEHADKGHEVLIQAAKILEPNHPNVQFVLAGSGRLEEALKKKAADLSNVQFEGWVDDPLSWIGALDVFAHPALREALGSTILDALRAGAPVVASRVDGIPDIVNANCGVLVPPGDPEALAEGLVRLYQDEALRDRLGQNATQQAEQYSPKKIAQDHLTLYQTLKGR